MKILILEDEIPAYQKLIRLISAEIEDSRIIAWARSIKEAKAILASKEQETPDLIFSDIELLDGTSFQVFEDIKVDCPIIFCTGFDQYLMQAFQSNGIAYILKPYTKEDFREAYKKYQRFFARSTTTTVINEELILKLKEILYQDRSTYKQRFVVKKKGGIVIIEVDKVTYFEANGDFSFAIDVSGKKHLLNQSLSSIEEQLDPNNFFRINRGQIVHIKYIVNIAPYFKNRLHVKLNSIPEALLTSSSKTPAFRKWLEG
jgi:DNA-binding LytR/AlgR family response regulator